MTAIVSPEASTLRRFRGAALVALAVVLAAGAIVPTYLLLRAKAPASPAPGISASANRISLAPGASQWRYIEIAVAEAKPPLPPLPAPARVTFDEFRTSAVGAPLPGRIENMLVRSGDRVEKGARLFSMRSGAFAELRRDVEAAHAEAITKHRVADRVRELVGLEAAAMKEQLAAEAEAHEADLAVAASTAKLASLKVAGDGSNLFWVVSPRRGTVVDLDVSPNQEVTPDRDRPLMRISDLDEVLVLADVQEAAATDIQRGLPVEVRTLGGITRAGVVDQVAEVVDPTRRTVAVRVRVANQDRALRPNAMAEVVFRPSSEQKRVRIPSEAVVTDGPRRVVFLAREGGHLDRTRVTVGRERDGETEILSGLHVGERYVAKGALLLLNQIELAD
jgi:cobalt-zinc-cadmium efflux system membrane fusion protein